MAKDKVDGPCAHKFIAGHVSRHHLHLVRQSADPSESIRGKRYQPPFLSQALQPEDA